MIQIYTETSLRETETLHSETHSEEIEIQGEKPRIWVATAVQRTHYKPRHTLTWVLRIPTPSKTASMGHMYTQTGVLQLTQQTDLIIWPTATF